MDCTIWCHCAVISWDIHYRGLSGANLNNDHFYIVANLNHPLFFLRGIKKMGVFAESRWAPATLGVLGTPATANVFSAAGRKRSSPQGIHFDRFLLTGVGIDVPFGGICFTSPSGHKGYLLEIVSPIIGWCLLGTFTNPCFIGFMVSYWFHGVFWFLVHGTSIYGWMTRGGTPHFRKLPCSGWLPRESPPKLPGQHR